MVGWTDAPVIEGYQNLTWLNGVNYRTEHLMKTLKTAANEADGIILLGNIRPGTIRRVVREVRNVVAVFSAYPSEESPGYLGDHIRNVRYRHKIRGTDGDWVVSRLITAVL